MQIPVNLKDHDKRYTVFIDELDEICIDEKIAVVTNTKVAPLWLDEVKRRIKSSELHIITVADGEEYKNMQTLEFMLNEMFKFKLDRNSVLIALGGGVISDMTGFAASIYERGIGFINIATTLLSQVDASVGGKTGINNKFGKNLIGTFHQPKAVYCESKFLKTLDERNFAAGIAEAIKIAVMFDSEFFNFFENHAIKDKDEIAYIISKCVKIKSDVVCKDEKEQGVRAVLNYGHTFAHVIENLTNYKKYLHGEAVSMGMNMANSLAVNLGLLSKEESKRIKEALLKFKLPVEFKVDNVDKFYDMFFLDKKSHNNKIKFILPNAIGKNLIKTDIDKNIVKSTLKEFK